MEVSLTYKPKNAIIIDGFPGLGFVGTIATEFLIDHLGAKPIGKLWSPNMPPMAVIHQSDLRRLLEVFYSKKYNIVLLHAIAGTQGLEWELAQAILDLAEHIKAKEIVSLEGVGSPMGVVTDRAFYYTNAEKCKNKLEKLKFVPLREGMIMGVSGALMLRAPKTLPISYIFAETNSQLPDSRAAAALVKALDKYLNLKVDYKPLLAEAEKRETKVKEIFRKSQEAVQTKREKEISYLG